MPNYQELVREIAQELYNDDNVIALILYGSVSRNEECANSDIDLLAIINNYYLQKRQTVRNGVTVEFVEMNIKFMQDFISKKEIPMLFALTTGTMLFDKTSITEKLISEAKTIIETGPVTNLIHKSDEYKIKKRSDLTEIYHDLLDVTDEITFNYIASLLITNAIPWLIENNNLWYQTRKKTISHLKSHCLDGYKYIEILLDNNSSLNEKREAATNLIEYALNPHGGIVKGDSTIFRKTEI